MSRNNFAREFRLNDRDTGKKTRSKQSGNAAWREQVAWGLRWMHEFAHLQLILTSFVI